MKRRILFTCAVIIVMITAMTAWFGFLWDDDYGTYKDEIEVETWNEKDAFMESKDNSRFYKMKLPQDVSGKVVGFLTCHFEVEATIEGKQVYQLKPSHPKWNRSTGFYWNYIPLSVEDAGKTLCITITSPYKELQYQNNFYYGERTDVVRSVLHTKVGTTILDLLIILVGIGLFIYTMLRVDEQSDALCFFALFAILLGVWSLFETVAWNLVWAHPMAQLVIDHYALMFLAPAFALFMRGILGDTIGFNWDFYVRANTIVVIVRTLLQVFGILDFRQTLWMTQLSILVLIGCSTYMTLKSWQTSSFSKQVKVHIYCIAIVFLASLLEFVMFHIFQKGNVFSTIGLTIYVIVVAADLVHMSQKTAARVAEAELYHKMAYFDEMTNIYNRTAFDHDMSEHDEVIAHAEQPQKLAIFLFDLNDLKKCNDNFGHEYGDQYIKKVAAVLKTIFDLDGRCYRIGGDEFCAILPYVNLNEVDFTKRRFENSIKEVAKEEFVVPVEVAVGCATYDAGVDASLEDTMRRADSLMYQNKKMLKSARKVVC